MASRHFRAGVVAVVRHPDLRRVMVFERADAAGHWQFPQGGIDRGEEPVVAAWRELLEETGLGPEHVVARAEFPEWVVYEWPAEVQASHGRGKRMGQAQRWFLFDALHADLAPSPDGSELTAWRWVEPTWIVEHVIEFRRPAYERVLANL